MCLLNTTLNNLIVRFQLCRNIGNAKYLFIVIAPCRGNNVIEWNDNINNSATKKKDIHLFVGSWNVEGYTTISVSSDDLKYQFWGSVDKDLIPTWNCHMTPFFEDQTNRAPLKNSLYVSLRVGVSNWSVLSGILCAFIASRWILRTRVAFRIFLGV